MTISTEEMKRLRVPLPDLRGFSALGLLAYADGKPGIVVGEEGHDGAVFFDIFYGEDNEVGTTYRPRVAVDLADSATRDRVVRWVAERAGLEIGNTAPGWICVFRAEGFGRWSIDGRYDRQRTYHGGHHDCGEAVRGLQDIDATDTRSLPDGSSFADALALAAVAQHLGTQT